MSQLSTLISEGKALGVSILPVLNMDPTAFSSETAAYNAAYAMASTYAKAFPGMTWELTNELDIPSMISGTSGQNTSDYNTTTYTMSRGLINGMYNGIHQADPTSLGVVDNAGWFHFGFLDKLAADGVKWDITAEHWYSDYGSMTNVGGSGTDALANLAALGHPIEITEFNENQGSARDGTQAEANYLTTTMQQVDSIAAKYNITAGYIYELLDDPRLPNYGLADASGNLKAAGTAVENFLAANPSAPGFPTGSAAGSPSPAPASTPTPAASGSTTGTGPDTLVLHLSEDAWSGNAQFSVSIDGKQLATGQSVTASHAAGQTEDFTYNGTFGSGAHTVAVTFLNDGYGGSAATDRNLYVNGLSYDGQQSSATAALQTTGAVGTFTVTGPTPTPAPAPSPTPAPSGGTTGTGPDALVLHLSEDAWSGNAQFSVSVDGKQLATGQSVTASHAAGQTQDFTYDGNFGSGAHTVAVTFLNDGYGGSAATDRNLYVNGLSYDGQQSSATAALQTTGAVGTFTVTSPTPTPTPAPASTPTPAPASTPTPAASGGTTGTGPDTLVLHLSEDAWSGNAQFSVSVDGKQLATGQSVTASHIAGQTEDFTYDGNFGSGAHTVAVTFLNDAYGGSAATDRNLYVAGLDYDGQHSSATAALQTTGAVDTFTVTTPTPTPAPAPAPAPTPAPTPAPSSGAVIANPDAHATPVETRSYVVADSTGTAHGTAGANDLYTTADGQTLIGGGGDDVFHISSNVNSHIVVGGSGVTTVSTYAANYTLAAGVNNLQLQGNYAHVATGNGLANYITGSDGNDTIHGGGGNDTFAVGTGANTLTGGGQHDLFVFSKAADHGNVVTDFHVGQDMLDLRAMMKDAGYTGADPIADHTLSLIQHGVNTSIDLTVNGASHTVVTLQNVAANALHAGQDYLWH